jgi:uncharacterized SAM-dependent methyltransferase
LSKPVMFVGSSSQTSHLIRAMGRNLRAEVVVKNWATTVWRPSSSTTTDIERMLKEADFGGFILAADDTLTIDGERVWVPRDNVLFELGMSFGRLGPERTFILVPQGSNSDLKLPTDLLGITVIPYERGRDDEETMGSACDALAGRIAELGFRDQSGMNGALERGGTNNIATVADGALHVFESRNAYSDELRRVVNKKEKVPAKFQFAQADGGRYWLQLCRSNNYLYFERAKKHLSNNVTSLVSKVHKVTGSTAVDFVSLGCGDGTKDDLILHALAAELAKHEYLYYYPVDISDILLVEAVRQVSQHGLKHSQFRCKPVLGDFTRLPSLEGIIDHRSNVNLFSVLGNAIGSFDESDILTSVAGAMRRDDFVLLEANIGEPAASLAMLKDQAANQWDLSTLAALGIAHDSCDLRQEERDGGSVVPGTRTLVSYAKLREPPGTEFMLSAMHHYDFESLKERAGKDLKVEWIAELPGDGPCEGVCLLLGQRKTG